MVLTLILYDAVHAVDAVDYHIDQANDPPGPAYSLGPGPAADPDVIPGLERDPSIYMYIETYIKRDPVSAYQDPVPVMVEPIDPAEALITNKVALTIWISLLCQKGKAT